MNIRQGLQAKKQNLNRLQQLSQKSKLELTQIIRGDAGYFNQFLTHVGDEKVESFLQKQGKYKEQKEQIRKLKQQIETEELKQRYDQLNLLQIPSPLRRALVSPMCPICLQKHEWKQVVILTCGHIYHGACLQQMTDHRCAVCRQQIILPRQRNLFDNYDP